MLVTCPDCNKEVSDRARACPGCGFPIAEHLAEQARLAAVARDRQTRARLGEVDCVACEARGFAMLHVEEADGTRSSRFSWCSVCEHTGRVALCRSERGYFAVARAELEAFVSGARDDGDDLVVYLGSAEPGPHRYPQAGPPGEDGPKE